MFNEPLTYIDITGKEYTVALGDMMADDGDGWNVNAYLAFSSKALQGVLATLDLENIDTEAETTILKAIAITPSDWALQDDGADYGDDIILWFDNTDADMAPIVIRISVRD